jgi:hypothetical protein
LAGLDGYQSKLATSQRLKHYIKVCQLKKLVKRHEFTNNEKTGIRLSTIGIRRVLSTYF